MSAAEAGTARNSKLDRDVVLFELKRLSARLLLAKTEVDSAGVALRCGAIQPYTALEWLLEIDPELYDLIGIIPAAEVAA